MSFAKTDSDMRYYFDTSALLKRVIPEKHSDALNEFMNWAREHSDTRITSQLAYIEVERGLRRNAIGNVDDNVKRALDGVDRYPLDDTVITHSATIGPDSLRTLDAVHLATAYVCGANALITYDERLRWAAFEVGITVIQPGGPMTGDLPPGWSWMAGAVPMDDLPAEQE